MKLKIKSKPVIKEAVHWDGDDIGIIREHYPDLDFEVDGVNLILKTLEGPMECPPGDYIIRGIKGEYYSIDSDIFKQSYDILDNNGEIIDSNPHIKTFKLKPTDNLKCWRHVTVCYKGKPIGPVIDCEFSLMAVQLDMPTEDFIRDYYNETLERI